MRIVHFEVSGRIWIEHNPVANFTLLIDGKEISMVTLHPNKKSTLSISGIVDAQGNPTLPNATPMYIPSQTGTVTLIPTTDGMSCDVVWLASSETPTVVTVGVDGITKTATFQTTGGAVADFTLNEGPEVDA